MGFNYHMLERYNILKIELLIKKTGSLMNIKFQKEVNVSSVNIHREIIQEYQKRIDYSPSNTSYDTFTISFVALKLIYFYLFPTLSLTFPHLLFPKIILPDLLFSNLLLSDFLFLDLCLPKLSTLYSFSLNHTCKRLLFLLIGRIADFRTGVPCFSLASKTINHLFYFAQNCVLNIRLASEIITVFWQ